MIKSVSVSRINSSQHNSSLMSMSSSMQGGVYEPSVNKQMFERMDYDEENISFEEEIPEIANSRLAVNTDDENLQKKEDNLSDNDQYDR